MDEGGVVVFALTDKNIVVVEARWRAYEVPLSDECRLVASLLHQLGHRLLTAVKHPMLVVREPILVRKLSRNHASATGPGK